jgi:hypothetical protein
MHLLQKDIEKFQEHLREEAIQKAYRTLLSWFCFRQFTIEETK